MAVTRQLLVCTGNALLKTDRFPACAMAAFVARLHLLYRVATGNPPLAVLEPASLRMQQAFFKSPKGPFQSPLQMLKRKRNQGNAERTLWALAHGRFLISIY